MLIREKALYIGAGLFSFFCFYINIGTTVTKGVGKVMTPFACSIYVCHALHSEKKLDHVIYFSNLCYVTGMPLSQYGAGASWKGVLTGMGAPKHSWRSAY